MRHPLLLSSAISVFIGCSLGSHLYTGYQVLRVIANDSDQLNYLQKLSRADGKLDFWTEPSSLRPTDIMVASRHVIQFKKELEMQHIQYTEMISDVQWYITLHEKETQRIVSANKNILLDWNTYRSYNFIVAWLYKTCSEHRAICKAMSIGVSTEENSLDLIKISTTLNSSTPRPAIWIDGGIHAREWISPATVTYFINELLTNTSQYSDILSTVDFYILPIMNPDGYIYTWNRDRLWRKTRSNYSDTQEVNPKCIGVDANRNFGYKFGGLGTSEYQCSEIYRGPKAFSEPETRAVRDFILNSGINFEGYITMHSYSQVWLYPWGYTSDLPADWKDLDTLAKAGAAAIKKRYGTEYKVGSSTNVLYPAAGGSDDWAKGEAKIKYSYTIELRDTGKFGFLLPSYLIRETAEEVWDGVQVVARHIAANSS